MKTRGLILLLLSGWVLVCHLQTYSIVRRFHVVREERTWIEARRYCRKNFIDLATIRDETDRQEAMQMLRRRRFWIGLYHSKYWKWIDDDQENFIPLKFFRWDSGKPDNNNCVLISKSGVWSSEGCGNLYPAMCYSAENDKHILVKQPMNWFQALNYCRSRYKSLSSIRNSTDNMLVTVLLQTTSVSTTESGEDDSTDPSKAWIGLHRRWKWSDGTFPRNLRGQVELGESPTCVTMDSSGDWSGEDCREKRFFLCYTDVQQSVRRTVKVRLTAGSANLNDPALQDAVLQQLKQTLVDGGIREEVKLRWRRQPDGKIFHREEEEEEEEEEEDDCDSSIWTP